MRLFRKLIILAIGLPLVALGIVLIPLPGPGLVVMFLGLFVLSLEFDKAKHYLEECKKAFRKIYAEAKARADKIEKR